MALKEHQTRVLTDLADHLGVLDGAANLAQTYTDYWASKGVRVNEVQA